MSNYNSLQHIFLIAMPQIKDPFFMQSVIYLWEYNESGAKGLIINKPMKSNLGYLLRHLQIPVQDQRAEVHPVLLGGPIASDQGFLLQRKHDINLETGKTELRITLGSSKSDLQLLADGTKLEDTLVAIGFSSWESGQLDQELKNNDWLVAPFNEDTLFSAISNQTTSEINTVATWRHAAATLGVNVSDLSLDAGHA